MWEKLVSIRIYAYKKRNRLAWETVEKIVQVNCNLQLVDKIESICYADEYIDWSSETESSDED